MYIRTIELNNFRNYHAQRLTVKPDINVFHGDNAQGKTNILEAVYLCACARSHRTSRDTDLILRGANHYSVRLEYVTGKGQQEELELRYFDPVPGDPQRQRPVRQIYQNGLLLERVSDLMGLFHAVIFAPEDLMLIKEGPASRRRFLDLLISQVRPVYFQDLQRFSRLLQQRNKLLKDLRESRMKETGPATMGNTSDEREQVAVWDLSLAQCAARIIFQRQKFVERLNDLACYNHQQLSSGKEEINVKYRTFTNIMACNSVDEICERLILKYKTNLSDDIFKGLTSIGPHRDDLELTLNGESMKLFASQGQQRSAVLSMKLAELSILTEEIGERPVLLLDDVMSELDAVRRACLLKGMDQAQVFISCTDLSHVIRKMVQTGSLVPAAAESAEGSSSESNELLKVSDAENCFISRNKSQFACYSVLNGQVIEDEHS
jgi:DNA replication and repair protein RecF